MCVFFFFQAEDGIRDGHVTGVQTCALPICTTGPTANLNIIFLLIYFFIFSYLPLTIIVFLLLSIVAYIGTWIAKFLHRKLRFSLLWKMSAYLTTIPFLIYMILSFFKTVNDQFLWFIFIYALAFLVKVITVYPKRRRRNKK